MQTIISISNLSKIYAGGFQALKDINLDIKQGEILALLGPNGAGKTTLISTICGIVSPSSGTVTVSGFDIISDYRQTRSLIGLVPQELTLGSFDTVWEAVSFSRGLYGKKPNKAYLEKLLKDLSLWDKKNSALMTLSGGMKRRVLIAKALSHEPSILFLDEPTAGVDVNLRKDMWAIVEQLRQSGVTIILTTHYIEEAEEIADRVGIITNGKLLLVEDKCSLMKQLGKRHLCIELEQPVTQLPESLTQWDLELSNEGQTLTYTYNSKSIKTNIADLLQAVGETGLLLKDINTSQSSLEDIFIHLVSQQQ